MLIQLLQYVKMIHNGIEHGMMSAQSEAWQIMSLCLGMSYDEIGDEFAKWNADGELVRNTQNSSISLECLTMLVERDFLDRHRSTDQQATRR